MFDLRGKVILITGGNGGLGLAMAKGIAKAGGDIAIWGRNAEKNQAAVEILSETGRKVMAFECDVTDTKSVDKAFAKTLSEFDHVDVCFANAGGAGPGGALHTLSDEAWQSVVDLNLNSVVKTFRPMITHLLARKAPGRLIVTSSIASQMGTGGRAGYSTTKAAVNGLVRALAIELGRSDIQVNAILPGFIETEMSLETSTAFQDACRRRAASGKIGTLADMEGVAVFLAANESRLMTGQTLVLDGGHLIHPM
jgi:NAD(P)-dependent dehydrogenase (short-subunit alcohol dehydrogenase family)